MSDVIPQQVGSGNVVTTAFTLGGGSWARRWGRQQPLKGTSATRILAEVREDVYSEDINGLAYDASTLWVRCRAADSTSSLNQDELDQETWTGVPATLPSGYTVRNTRNLGTSCEWGNAGHSAGQANPDIPGDFAPFYPAPLPTNFVRSASGLHVPRANDGIQKWGPWNLSNKYVYQTAANTTGPALYEHAIALGPPTGTVAIGGTSKTGQMLSDPSTYFWQTPGFRSVGCYFYCSDDWYLGTPPASFPTFISSTITFTLGSATLAITVNAGDLSFASYGGQDYYEVDLGNVGDLLADIGDAPEIYAEMTTTFTPSPIVRNIQGSGTFHFLFAPRVDIPLPFTATGPGNLVVPGGILTGSITGY